MDGIATTDVYPLTHSSYHPVFRAMCGYSHAKKYKLRYFLQFAKQESTHMKLARGRAPRLPWLPYCLLQLSYFFPVRLDRSLWTE